MSQLPPQHQYIGRDGRQAQQRRMRRTDRAMGALLEQRARLARWLDREPAMPATVRETRRLIILHLAHQLAVDTGATEAQALDSILAKLEAEQTTLPRLTKDGFFHSDLLTI